MFCIIAMGILLIFSGSLSCSLMILCYALFKYNDWFSGKIFSMGADKFENLFLHTNFMKKKNRRSVLFNVNWK